MVTAEIEFNQELLIELVKKDIRNFCRRAGVSRQQAYLYMHGNMMPNIRTLIEICRGFNIKPADFFSITNI